LLQPRVSNPLAGAKLYGTNAPALRQAQEWGTNTVNGQLMQRMGNIPSAQWIGGWSGDVATAVANISSAATSQGALPTLIAYNIPNRDCSNYSAGGATSEAAYNSWIDGFGRGLGGRKAVVVLEPDALALPCSDADLQLRYRVLSRAVDVLTAKGAIVYLDGGHSAWIDSDTMTNRLTNAGVRNARGFALNVSNFQSTAANVAYGNKLASALNTHYVIDTSRNGNGPNGEWCNPSGRALGETPTTQTASTHADAYLWLKTPGESDGSCNGGPAAGAWFSEYALGLAQRAWQ